MHGPTLRPFQGIRNGAGLLAASPGEGQQWWYASPSSPTVLVQGLARGTQAWQGDGEETGVWTRDGIRKGRGLQQGCSHKPPNHLSQGGGSPHHLHRCSSGQRQRDNVRQSQRRAAARLRHSLVGGTKPFPRGERERMTSAERRPQLAGKERWTAESLLQRRCHPCAATGDWCNHSCLSFPRCHADAGGRSISAPSPHLPEGSPHPGPCLSGTVLLGVVAPQACEGLTPDPVYPADSSVHRTWAAADCKD